MASRLSQLATIICDNNNSLIISFADIMIIVTLCSSFVDLRWFYLLGGPCTNIDGEKVSRLGLLDFYHNGQFLQSQTGDEDYVKFKWSGTLSDSTVANDGGEFTNCVSMQTVTILRCVGTLIICSVFLVFASFLLSIIPVKAKVPKMLRDYAAFNITAIIVCQCILILAYFASESIYQTLIHYREGHELVEVRFGLSFFYILWASLLLLVATALTLLQGCRCRKRTRRRARRRRHAYYRMREPPTEDAQAQARDEVMARVTLAAATSHRGLVLPPPPEYNEIFRAIETSENASRSPSPTQGHPSEAIANEEAPSSVLPPIGGHNPPILDHLLCCVVECVESKRAHLPMGILFLEHPNGKSTTIFCCYGCQAPLANKHHLESDRFTGSTGRAYLFRKAVNLTFTSTQERTMLTGRHFVRDCYCLSCKEKVGWMYEFAVKPDQQYKEGQVILERAMLTEVDAFIERDPWDPRKAATAPGTLQSGDSSAAAVVTESSSHIHSLHSSS